MLAQQPYIESETEVSRVVLRWMIRRDMAEVMAIERASFEFPWTEEDFIRCLTMRNCIGMVACDSSDSGPVIGMMLYELHKTRLHVLSIAVLPDCRRQGVGRQMFRKLEGKLARERRNHITLEVRETNLPAQKFFRDCGFRAVKVLHSYYEDPPEDAYLMQYQVES